MPRLKIVIADDEEDIRQGFRRLLCKLGCEVVGEASNGRELVDVCLSVQPDLVITDIRMPEMSGIEAARVISKSQSIPVIVVSSYERPPTSIALSLRNVCSNQSVCRT
jgi:two-component system, response regulator PdtaR